LNDVYCGVPVKLNANGIEKILELKLTDEEIAGLKRSADDVAANIKKLDI